MLNHWLSGNLDLPSFKSILLCGDFNLHHPLWNPPGYISLHPNEADDLLQLMNSLSLSLALPPGTITFPTDNAQGGTTIDLVFTNEAATNTLLKCQIAELEDHGSDHEPIEIHIELDIPLTPPPQVYNFKKTNWETFYLVLQESLPPPLQIPATSESIDFCTESIVYALQHAISSSTPWYKSSPYSKPWWTEDLTTLRKEANHLKNRFKSTKNPEDKKQWRTKLQRYKAKIKYQKKSHWQEFLTNVDSSSVWKAATYLKGAKSFANIPTLSSTNHPDAISFTQKTEAFHSLFFPPSPEANTTDIHNFFPPSVPFGDITLRQIERTIMKMTPNKAPGPDLIPNLILQKALPFIKHHLKDILQEGLNIGHYPTILKHSYTIVIRKSQKPDYSTPNAYRPIALEATLGKILEATIAESLMYIAEEYELLPTTHFGGRKGRSSEDALLILEEKIHEAWRSGKVLSTLFLDVSGAFNNVVHTRMIFNLKKRRVPNKVAEWILSFLTGRSTSLAFNRSYSPPLPTLSGIPQGSPLSPILYLFYNADLFDNTCLGFIDDIAKFTSSSSAEQNSLTLSTWASSNAIPWKIHHGSSFDISKFQLVHFTRNKNTPINSPIYFDSLTIFPSLSAKYLGLLIDYKLNWKSQVQHAAKKGIQTALAINRLSSAKWGINYINLRRLFLSIVIPRMFYGAIIWHRPGGRGCIGQASKLASAQRTLTRLITGAFRTTSNAALDLEASIIPISFNLEKTVISACIRLLTLPILHPLHNILTATKKHQPISFRSNLHHLFSSFKCLNVSTEIIQPYIVPPWWIPVATCIIPRTKEDAKSFHENLINLHQNNVSHACIYTDGSGNQGNIGAAAYSPTTHLTTFKKLGKDTEFNVYAGELYGIILALRLCLNYLPTVTSLTIFIDNQAAISAFSNPFSQSGQTLLVEALDLIQTLNFSRYTFSLSLVWTPGHCGIIGNEIADAAAKRACSLCSPSLSGFLKSAIRTSLKKKYNQEWIQGFMHNSKTGSFLQYIHSLQDPTPTSSLKLHTHLTREQSGRLTQLRTGHIALNAYLFRINQTPSPLCECGRAPESVQHFLLSCPLWQQQRIILQRNCGTAWSDFRILLNTPILIPHVLKYTLDTQRLNYS
jgi:ribonuclease HI